MSKKPIKPCIPIWAQPGHTVVREWVETVRSGDAAEGLGVFVEYEDKKGKRQSCMKYVKWIKSFGGCDYKDTNPYLTYEGDTKKLSFHTLREATLTRLPQYKNSKGEPAHTEPDGSDWSPAEWLECITGELGEYANWRKKYRRGDISEAQFKKEAAKELADVMCYLDILAYQIGIDLGDATVRKFNEISERVGVDVFIHGDKVWDRKI